MSTSTAGTKCLPTRLVGRVLGSGTEPCRRAGDVDRLAGALVEWDPGKSPVTGERLANDDAPLASDITLAGACSQSQARLQTHIGAVLLYTPA